MNNLKIGIVIAIAAATIQYQQQASAQLFGYSEKDLECAKKEGMIEVVNAMINGGIEGMELAGNEVDPVFQNYQNGLTKILLQIQADYNKNC